MILAHPPLALPNNRAQQSSRLIATSIPDSIEVARVMLVIGLVFLHYFAYPNSRTSPFTGLDPAHHPFATFVNSFILLFFFSAVPLLSTIAGWLFFNLADNPMKTIQRRIRGRFSSLLMPLITWNILALLTGFAVYMAAPTSGLNGSFGFNFDHAGAFDYANAILGIIRLPIAFQFWFVHDLFLTVMLSPFLWLMLRYAPLVCAIGLGLAWIAELKFGIFFRTDVLFFFFLGGLARKCNTSLVIEWSTTWILLSVYVLLMAARALAPLIVDPTIAANAFWLDLATRLARPLGVVACWGTCLEIAKTRLGATIVRYGGFAFFLHAAHFPLIAIVKFVLWRLVPEETDAWMLAHYVTSVAITVGIAALVAAAIFRASPGVYSFLAGGRRFA